MESLRNEPVIFSGLGSAPVAAPYGGYGGYGHGFGLSESLGAAIALRAFNDFGHNRGGLKGADIVELQQLHSLSREVGDAKADIRSDVKDGVARVLDRLCDAEKEAIKSGFENRIALSEAKGDIISKIDTEICTVKGQIGHLNANINHLFCEFGHRMDRDFRDISDKFKDSERREVERENHRLNAEILALKDKIREEHSERRIIREVKEAICDRTIIRPVVRENVCPPVTTLPNDCNGGSCQ